MLTNTVVFVLTLNLVAKCLISAKKTLSF